MKKNGTQRAEETGNTIPWSDYEKIGIDGNLFIYTFENEEMLVIFPGGNKIPVGTLKRRKITPPETIREWA